MIQEAEGCSVKLTGHEIFGEPYAPRAYIECFAIELSKAFLEENMLDASLIKDTAELQERNVKVQKLLENYKDFHLYAYVDTDNKLNADSVYYFEAKDSSGNLIAAQAFDVKDSVKDEIIRQAAPLIQQYFRENPPQFPVVKGIKLDLTHEIEIKSKSDTYEYGSLIGTTQNSVAYFQPGRECTDIISVEQAEAIINNPDIQYKCENKGKQSTKEEYTR